MTYVDDVPFSYIEKVKWKFAKVELFKKYKSNRFHINQLFLILKYKRSWKLEFPVPLSVPGVLTCGSCLRKKG